MPRKQKPIRNDEPPKRMTFYLSEDYRQKFLAQMGGLGYRSISDYIVDLAKLNAKK